jgi:hypothetical protein
VEDNCNPQINCFPKLTLGLSSGVWQGGWGGGGEGGRLLQGFAETVRLSKPVSSSVPWGDQPI